MSDEGKITMVVGEEESVVLATALGALIPTISADIDSIVEFEGCGKTNLLLCLSMQLTAISMYRALWTMLGVPAEQVEAQLAELGVEV